MNTIIPRTHCLVTGIPVDIIKMVHYSIDATRNCVDNWLLLCAKRLKRFTLERMVDEMEAWLQEIVG